MSEVNGGPSEQTDEQPESLSRRDGLIAKGGGLAIGLETLDRAGLISENPFAKAAIAGLFAVVTSRLIEKGLKRGISSAG